MKMDHTISRNFSTTIGITTIEYLNRLLGIHKKFIQERNNKIKMNSKKFYVKTSNWRFKDPKVFFPLDSYKKLYKNSRNEYIKCRILWIRFKFNPITRMLCCSGKFISKIKLDNEWKVL